MIGVIVAILTGIAAPSMQALIERNRTNAQVNAIFGALMAARGESISRNQPTVLCKSNNRTHCAHTGNWEQGWLVFVDDNGNELLDIGEDVVHSKAQLSANYTLRATAPINHTLSFLANGATKDAGSFALCPPSKNKTQGYTMVLSITGRAHLSKAVNSCP